MKELEELFNSWNNLRNKDHNNAKLTLKKARRIISVSGSDGWSWVSDSLHDEIKKWFIASIFEKMPVPNYLFNEMLYASIMEGNPSSNRKFIEPCVRSFGVLSVLNEILKYLETGSNREKAGAVSILYWIRETPDEKIPEEIYTKIRCWRLREFVNNEDVALRQRIVPALILDPKCYPEELHNLIQKAIQIAQKHPDEYIRHRIEIQLGGEGPYKPLPNLK